MSYRWKISSDWDPAENRNDRQINHTNAIQVSWWDVVYRDMTKLGLMEVRGLANDEAQQLTPPPVHKDALEWEREKSRAH